MFKMLNFCPSKYSLFGCASFHKLKGHPFNSRPGHMPGLHVQSPVGALMEDANLCFSLILMFLSLTFSFLSPLSKIKINK